MADPRAVDPEIQADAHRLSVAGASREMVLVFLRDKGLDKIDSIKVIRVLYGLSMPDAKELIDHSDAWSDRFHSDMQLRETARRALRDLAASKDPSLPKIEFTESEE